ncbi:MAG: Crp/Fnr family transcriptional regulator [Rhodoferax sp.]
MPHGTCTLCQPAALQTLLRSHPQAAAQWAVLPRLALAPGQCLLRAGEPVTQSWWIESGLVRSYYLDEHGVESNHGFHCEGDWVGHGVPPVESVSEYHIEALESSALVVVPYATLRTLLASHPALEALLHEAQNSCLAAQARREASLLGHTHVQRYQAFRSSHAHMQERIALHHVARYLGISSVSLSRIRARLGLVPKR